ncbi:single-stranded nucleic acid binding R3H domain protein [Desulfofarcimen acetoxidans DSM 771]|uniref:RNA-binding protein KhpB n=1 Tax=Desulfofarcimen acetoxidans (strain ATCC 49208 / DSM 771 / KCTC 5769 / VKM B-1644 / 5575) TaxID=485916 RepID=C8W061_DESAS|nr:RNA-binding cell elongation regulator Jag/EloR [Desulfofarcimen acetoxidans]ACV65029.1 single-stranded nucleic acid binding R3H domain protein [Desulfofarcimen acetoxidans DSM 771]
MKVIEKTGKTVEEAVSSALVELGVSRDKVEIEILENPSKILFGIFGSKPARVKVIMQLSPTDSAVELLNNIVAAMDLTVDYTITERDNISIINLQGKDLGILIGRRGETLDALQYIINLSVNKSVEQRKKIVLDVEGYRDRREETLQRLALKLANKARQRGRNIVLEPMNSQERRIIHTALQGYDDIYTFSEGEEPYRKIVISIKK